MTGSNNGILRTMQGLDKSKIVYFLGSRRILCVAMIVLFLGWPGIVLGDSGGRHPAANTEISSFPAMFRVNVHGGSSQQTIMMDANARQASVLQETLDAETVIETPGGLPLEEDLKDCITRPDCLPLTACVAAETNRTSVYYLTSSRINPAPTLTLAYDSEREDQFLYGMISLTIRW